MQLRMASRRSLNGSMTVVGDIAQATGTHAPRDWADVLAHLPDRRPARLTELTVGYRIPAQVMALAARVLRVTAPSLQPPDVGARRRARARDRPHRRRRPRRAPSPTRSRRLGERVGDGSVAVVAPGLAGAGRRGRPRGSRRRRTARRPSAGSTRASTSCRSGWSRASSSTRVVVVEPARIVREEAQGLRALYVALTRSTKELAVVHAEPLPEALLDGAVLPG